jgi:hypothetical protein
VSAGGGQRTLLILHRYHRRRRHLFPAATGGDAPAMKNLIMRMRRLTSSFNVITLPSPFAVSYTATGGDAPAMNNLILLRLYIVKTSSFTVIMFSSPSSVSYCDRWRYSGDEQSDTAPIRHQNVILHRYHCRHRHLFPIATGGDAPAMNNLILLRLRCQDVIVQRYQIAVAVRRFLYCDRRRCSGDDHTHCACLV